MARETWMWLADGLGYGAVNSGELLAAFPGGAEEIEQNLGGDALDDILTQKQADRLAGSRPADFALTLSRAEAMGVTALPFDDPDYPDVLQSIHNPPPVLFVKGDLSLLNGQLSVGIVGARRPSAYGVEAVKTIGRGVALGGAIIVSGLAAGLDAEAHKAALAVNGPTIACIAFGHDTCYPAANRKLMEVIEKYGAVVSEYPVGTSPEKPFFLQRNRLIAGLSHALVVAEARKYSGTMSTVNFATDFGRDVFAVPGSIFSELSGGTNAMIREGAYVAASASDILALYGIELPGEDPVAAATKQAADGRPLPAEALSSPWNHSPSRREGGGDREPAQGVKAGSVDFGEMTLGEALQSATGRQQGDDRVSSRQAIDAFRQLQREMPPTDDSALDARNRALDEMVLAVSDSVEIGGKTVEKAPPKTQKKPPPEKPEDRVKPFNWNSVERITTQKEPKGAKTATRQRNVTAPLRTAPRSLEPVGAVSAVEPVSAAMPVARVERAGAVGEPYPAVAEARQETAAPKPPEKKPEPSRPDTPKRREATKPPAQSPAQAKPKAKDSSLSGKLRTLSHTEETPVPRDLTSHMKFEPTETVEDEKLSGLDDTARQAYKQLGAKPVSLSKICEGSGLSSGEAMAALTELELAGLSRQLAGRQFVIVQ